MLSNANRYFIFVNLQNKWFTIDPNVDQILNFKFQNIQPNYFAACLIKDKNGNKGIALIPSKIVKKINNGSLWNDKDTNMCNLMMYEHEYEHEYGISSQFSPSASTTRILKKFAGNISEHRAIFLKSICSDSGVCMAFGKQSEKIKRHFDGFINFKYVDPKSEVKTISEDTTNGFIKEVTYKRDDYIANAVLKSSSKVNSDNLLYEYLVGQYINKKCRVFPCFVETYGWYQYNTETTWKYIKNENEIYADDLKSGLVLTSGNVALQKYREEGHHTCFKNKRLGEEKDCNEIDYFLKLACEKSKHLAILIQHIKDAYTLGAIISLNNRENPDYANFAYTDLLNVLYQIYMPLSTLREEFTHYDLHIKNILIYEPVKGKYIDYKYVYQNGDTVEFKCRYIAKIIDYGRCFFKDESNTEITGSSKLIYESICNNIQECNGCGEDKGFLHFDGLHSVKSTVRNITHDLLLLYRVKKLLRHPKFSPYYGNFKELNDSLNLIFEKSNYYGNEETLEQEEALEQEAVKKGLKAPLELKYEYGSPEKSSSDSTKINNVKDLHDELKIQVMKSKKANDMSYDDRLLKYTSLGMLTIYESGIPMKFTPHPPTV